MSVQYLEPKELKEWIDTKVVHEDYTVVDGELRIIEN